MSMSEIVKKFDVQAVQITQWKKKLPGNAEDVSGIGEKAVEDTEKTVLELHAKIGQLTMEIDFLERGLTKIHGPTRTPARAKSW